MEALKDLTSAEAVVFLADKSFTYKEISRLLWKYKSIRLSANAIGKRLKRIGCFSRKGATRHQTFQVQRAIEALLPDLPETVGYRSMTNILHGEGVHVRRDTVMKIMKNVDPEGVSIRRRRRINRRIYQSFGPNHVWHVDGYDKLKPFGFAVHGCIDVYSRRIMWLNVGPSNNDPKIVATNFVLCVQKLQGCPMILQTDPGTENCVMGALQCVFRHRSEDPFSGLNSYRVVRSVFNQRIEAWWSLLKRRQSIWWIDFFKDLQMSGIFHNGNTFETRCLRYCFMHVIQNEFDRIKEEWNCHHLTRNIAQCPNGRPYILHTLCEDTDARDCLQNVEEEDIKWAFTECKTTSISGSDHFDIFATRVLNTNGLPDALTWQDALGNYIKLLECKNQYEIN